MLKKPVIDESVFIAPTATCIGDVVIGEDSSVWFGALVRGDSGPIRIGKGTNIQDNSVLHLDLGYEVHVGDYVTIGHGAIVHGCSVGDNTLIGMGAIILNGAKIGKNCIIGAGALVSQNAEIPDNSLVVGIPGRVKREISPEEAEHNHANALVYVGEAKGYIEYYRD